MEGNVGSEIQVAARRFWNIVRGMLLVLRKNISKKKPTSFDLDLILSRGKNIFYHHHSSAAARSRLGEYEFSCSSTPARVFPFPFHLPGKRKNSSASTTHFFACAHAWPETPDAHVHVHDRDHDHVMTTTSFGPPVGAAAYLRSPMTSSSPALPGFGRTPLVRQLRVTDSPFPIHDVEESYHIDKAAEEFIIKFYQHLRIQDSMAKKRNL